MSKKTRAGSCLLVLIFVLTACLFNFSSVAFAASTEPATAQDSSLVAHYLFNGDFKDASGNHNDGALVGSSGGVSFVNAIYGQGAKFDGNSYIEVNDSDSLDLTNAFTMSMWIYQEPMVAGVPYVIKMKDESQTYYPYGMYESEWLKPLANCAYMDGPGDIHREFATTDRLDIQKWTLLTATYDGKGVKMYLNDKLVKSDMLNVTLTTSSGPLDIGFGDIMGQHYFKGVMDDLRIYNTALSPDDVKGLYGNALASTSKEKIIPSDRLVAIYRFEGNGNDLSGMSNNGDVVGDITYVNGVAGKAAKFDGSSYFEVKDSDSLDLTKSFTMGAWLYEEKDTNKNPVFYKIGSSTSQDTVNVGKDLAWELYDNYHSGPVLGMSDFADINFPSSHSISTDCASFQTAPFKKWYYYTTTYDGKNIKLYIDGKLIKTEAYSETIGHSWGPLWIGGTTDTVFFQGMMDELRIYNYAMTPEQVKILYGCRDYLSAGSNVVKNLKINQTTNLTTNLNTYVFTPPVGGDKDGKNTFTSKTVTPIATYKSNNSKIVSVSKTGEVKGLMPGKATVTVSYGNLSMNLEFKVTK